MNVSAVYTCGRLSPLGDGRGDGRASAATKWPRATDADARVQEDGGGDRMDDDAYSAHLRRMMREKRQADAGGTSAGAGGTSARATAGPARPTAEQREQSRSASQAEAERLTREEEEKDRRWRERVSQGKGWQERRAKYLTGWYETNP